MGKKYIDLHVHSNRSDGFESVAVMINKAIQNNVGVLSFVEHYNIASYELAKKIARNKIEIIPGLELGTDMSKLGYKKNCKCHILVYYPNQVEIYKILNEYESERERYAIAIIRELNSKNINIKLEEVKANSPNKQSVGRYDVANMLIKLGIVKDLEEAYYKYLSYKNENNIERGKPSPEELLTKIGENGITVLAHPNSLRMVDSNGNISDEQDYNMNTFVESLTKAGLKGIEVQNSYITPPNTEYFTRLAEKYNLIVTVGSDYHARKDSPIEIGKGIDSNLCVSNYEIIQNLKNLARF